MNQEAGGEPPFKVTLAPWASDIAQDLKARFGEVVDLTVGALHFPDRTFRTPAGAVGRTPVTDQLPMLPSDLSVALAEPVAVRSGFDCRAALEIKNLGHNECAIHTNGVLTARVIDATSGRRVGGFSGAQALPLVVFRVSPGEIVSVPLLVGTSSFSPELGYAVPPGDWALEAMLDLHGRGRFRTPLLAFTVTS